MFGSVQSSILMFGEHYEHLGTSKVIQSVANMGYIKRKKIIIFSILPFEHSLLSIFCCNKIWHFVINNFSVWKKKLNPKIWSKIHAWLMPIKVRCSVLPVRSSVLKFKSHVRNVRSSVCQCSKCSTFDPPLVNID